jgi:hypothetical protein
MAKTSPFDYANAINQSKINLMRGTDNDALMEKDYNAFMVNRSLSYFPDTVGMANEMNIHHHLDNKLQFEFLINIVRPRKRFAKWAKKESGGDLALVKEYFGYNDSKALQALTILSDDDIKTIRKKLEKGGKNA